MTITVSCPSCSTSFPVDPDKVPEGGVNARCSECSAVFFVEKPAQFEQAAEAAEPTPEQVTTVPDAEVPEVETEGPADFHAGPDGGDPGDDDRTTAVAEPEGTDDDWAAAVTEPEEADDEEWAAGAAQPEGTAGDDRWGTALEEPEAPEEEADAGSFEPMEMDEPASPVEAEGAASEDSFGAEAEPPTEEAVVTGGFDAPLEVEEEAAPEPDTAEAEAVEEEPDGAVPETLATEAAPAPQGFQFGKRDPHDKARRLARVLVSDMIMYNPERHQRALEQGTLQADFEDEIGKSWEEYVEQVGEEIANDTSYFTDALNDILAKGEQVFHGRPGG